MKKITLLSDTHGHMDAAIVKHCRWADEIWHAGDIGTTAVTDQLKTLGPLRAVFGNIDGQQLRLEFPENQLFWCEDVKVVMTHIGGYPPKYNARVKALLAEEQPQLYICGHSHILKAMPDKQRQLLHLNPGAAGKQGFHQMRTMMRFCIDEKKIQNLEVIELGKRGTL